MAFCLQLYQTPLPLWVGSLVLRLRPHMGNEYKPLMAMALMLCVGPAECTDYAQFGNEKWPLYLSVQIRNYKSVETVFHSHTTWE